MSKRIIKHFDSLDKAEQFQDKLYDKYNNVVAEKSPMFSENGTYTWIVSDPF